MFLDIEQLNKVMPRSHGIYYVQFQPYHIEYIRGSDLDSVDESVRRDVSIQLKQQHLAGTAVTVMQGKKIVAIIGVGLYSKGVGEAWSLISDDARKLKFTVSRAAHTFLDICSILLDLHKLRICVKTSDKRAMLFAKHLGFVVEDIVPIYGLLKSEHAIMIRSKS
jgi:hypothetical protein